MQKYRRQSKVTIEDRAGTAQTLLSDFFEGGQFQNIKEKNIHKYRKLGGSAKTVVSEPNIPRVRESFPVRNEPNPKAVPLRSALKTPGLGIGGSVHLRPLHVDDKHSVSDMLHRVTLQTGTISRNDARNVTLMSQVANLVNIFEPKLQTTQ
jgi:hypothetical protein